MKNPNNRTNATPKRTSYCKFLVVFILFISGSIIPSTVFAQAFRSTSQGSTPDGKYLDVNKPGSLQVGDVMVVGITVRPWDVNIIGVPNGWVFIRSTSAGGTGTDGDNQQAIYYKVVDANDLLAATNSYQWKFNKSLGAVGGIIAFSGVETTTPVDKHAGANSGGGTLTFSSPGITTTYPNETVIGFHAYGSSGTWSNPAGATFPMTQRADIASGPVPDILGVSMEMSHGVMTIAGPTGSVSATASNDPKFGVSQIVALLPLTKISYPGTLYCQNGGQAPVTFVGVAGGQYLSTAGLVISQTTGTVNLAASSPGTYVVTYKYGASLQYLKTTSISINSVPTAISGGGTTVCQNAVAPNITFTGANGLPPYSFIYKINGGDNLTATTKSGNAVTISQPTGTAGPFVYTLVSVSDANSCTQMQTNTETITVTPTVGTPTSITVSGTEPTCQITNTTTKTTYNTTATNSTGFNWSLSDGAAGTISSAGVVSWTNGFSGTVKIQVTANGCNGPSPQVVRTVTIAPTVGSTSFAAGSTSTRCMAASSVTYTASATNATSISYTLDAVSRAAGNSIVATTGQINFVAGWFGTSTIVATAFGCNGPTYATHTVTTVVNPTASFSYTANPYCTNGGNASIIFSGTTGGMFLAPPGVSIASATGLVDVQASMPGSYTVNYRIPATASCPSTVVSAPLNINVHAIWNGSVSRNWHDANNWSCGGVPTLTSNAIIPTGMPRYPIIYLGTGTTNDLTIQKGASIVDSGTLKIAGVITNTDPGSINALAGKVDLAASTYQVIPSNLFNQRTIKDIVISSAAGIKLSGTLRVTGSVAFGNVNKTVFTTGDSLTLASVANSDAQIKDITNAGANSGNSIKGLIIVERYMSSRRAYRLATAPVNSAGSIKANWMENALNPDRYTRINPYPGYGTNITGSGDGANGFDPTQTHNPSMFTFNNLTQAWVALPNTNAIMSAGNPYRIISRGDRSTDLNSNTAAPTPTTLRATGSVVTGDFIVTKTGVGVPANPNNLSTTTGAYNLVANPYASAINWLSVDKTDVGGTIYIFDPTIAGSGGRGGYCVYNTIVGAVSNNGSLADNYIQSGQSVFVQSAGPNPYIRFKETDKVTSYRSVFKSGNELPNLSLQLLLPDQQTTNEVADGAKVFFSDDFDNSAGKEDSYKFANQDENIAIVTGESLLSIDGRKPVAKGDSVQLKLWQLTQKNYLLKVNFTNFSFGVEAYLKDKFLSTTTQLNTSGETIIPVTITSDAASTAPDRYKVVFEKFTTLPLHLLGIKAMEKNGGVQVEWTAESESNMDRYEIEKSSDGQHFVKAGTVKAKSNPGPSSFYTWFDLVPNRGDNFYKIKSFDKEGVVKYSSVAKVRLEKGAAVITLFPNPLQGRIIKLQFTNIKKGNYNVAIFSGSGDRVYNSTISHTGGFAEHLIELQTFLQKGVYQLQVSDNIDKETISLLVQ